MSQHSSSLVNFSLLGADACKEAAPLQLNGPFERSILDLSNYAGNIVTAWLVYTSPEDALLDLFVCSPQKDLTVPAYVEFETEYSNGCFLRTLVHKFFEDCTAPLTFRAEANVEYFIKTPLYTNVRGTWPDCPLLSYAAIATSKATVVPENDLCNAATFLPLDGSTVT